MVVWGSPYGPFPLELSGFRGVSNLTQGPSPRKVYRVVGVRTPLNLL